MVPLAATLVTIIGPVLSTHHLQRRIGATDRLQSALAQLTPDPRIAGLLIAWFFSLFLEGAAGFGTPVALAAPFLVAAGFRPLTGVTAALAGHAAGVSFGAFGTPVATQAAISGLAGPELARATANYQLELGTPEGTVMAQASSPSEGAQDHLGWPLRPTVEDTGKHVGGQLANREK